MKAHSKLHFLLVAALGLPIALAACRVVDADIVSVGISALAQAELENFSPASQSSTFLVASLSAEVQGSGNGDTSNSLTQSQVNYNWNATSATLSGSGLINARKLSRRRRGGDHHGDSDLILTFTVDELTNFAVAGDYGYFARTGTDDVISWSLVKSDASFSVGQTAALVNSSVTGQSFSASGQLTAGTYTFSILADLTEEVRSSPGSQQPTTRQAGWTLESFSLTPAGTAIPEPAAVVFLVLAGSAFKGRRMRSQQAV